MWKVTDENASVRCHIGDMSTSSIPTVRVDRDRQGAWQVKSPDQSRRQTYATLDDARRVAYGQAMRCQPCQLVIYDAYHRVARREMITTH
jgi:hypothetical protein